MVVGAAGLKDGDPFRFFHKDMEHMAHENAQEINSRHNVPKFFVEHPKSPGCFSRSAHLGLVRLSIHASAKGPRNSRASRRRGLSRPGATAQQVEQFITRRIEDVAAENKTIHPGTDADYGIKSISLPGYSFVSIQLDEGVTDTKRQFSDINLKLDALNSQLPQGAGPINFQSDFGDTAALMLTSPARKRTTSKLRLAPIPSRLRFAKLARQISRIERGCASQS